MRGAGGRGFVSPLKKTILGYISPRGEARGARQVLRAERDEAYAPATANYVSTELNLKDHRRRRGCRTRDLWRASRLGSLVDDDGEFRQRSSPSSPGSGGAPGRADRWKSPGDDISAGLILSAMLDNRDANNYED